MAAADREAAACRFLHAEPPTARDAFIRAIRIDAVTLSVRHRLAILGIVVPQAGHLSQFVDVGEQISKLRIE